MPKKVSNIEGSPKIYKDLCRRVHPPIPESIECFIEDQEFSPLYNLALPTTPPPSTVSKVNRRHTGRLEGGRADGEGAKSKAWSSISHWILSGCRYLNRLSAAEYNSIWEPLIFYPTKEPNDPNFEMIIAPGMVFTIWINRFCTMYKYMDTLRSR
jgi:hypothetical protein